MSPGVALVVAGLLLIANGFFVAIEFGLIATQRSQLENKAQEGNRRARSAMGAITDLNTQIAGAQLGISMASIALGLVAEPSVAKLLEKTILSGVSEHTRHTVGLVIALSLVTFLHILVGEMIPKNVALADPPRTAMALSPLHTLFVRIFGPLVWLLNVLANAVLRLLGVEALDERAQAKTPEELAMLLEEAHHGEVLDGYDFRLLSNTLELGAGSIREAVVPWSEVATALASAPVEEIEQSMAESGHSRLALVSDAGEPIGWVHAKDLLAVDSNYWAEPLPVHRKRRLLAIEHDMAVEDALEHMQSNRQHFALATDRGTKIGIITLEDVLEVLVRGLAGSQVRP